MRSKWLAAALVAIALIATSCSEPESPAVFPAADVDHFRAPAAFDSYRYTLRIQASTDLMDLTEAPRGLDVEDAVLSIDIEGARVNPDREYTRSSSSFGPLALERETILIGDEIWSRQATGAWRQREILTRVEDLVGQDVLLSPAVIFGDDDPETLRRITEDLEARPRTPDIVRGRATERWELDREWLRAYEEEFEDVIPSFAWPEVIAIELWGDAELRVATKLRVVASTPTNPNALILEMELFDFNDPTIMIDVPAGAIGPSPP